MTDQYKLIHPLKHFRDFIDNNVRFDGRSFDKSRPIALNTGSFQYAHGSSAVRLGNTNIVCGIRAKIAKPRPGEPRRGYLIPTVDMTFIPNKTNKTDAELPDLMVDSITGLVYDSIVDKRCIDLDDLCIQSEKAVWALYLEILCIEIDGSVLDAALFGSVSALKDLKLPKVTYDTATKKLEVNQDEHYKIPVGNAPTVSSHCVFDNVMLTDPTYDEEQVAHAEVHVGTCKNTIGVLHKRGGVPMKKEDIDKALDIAEEREKEVNKLFEDIL